MPRPDEAELRCRARELIDQRALPDEPIPLLWGAHGHGMPCSLCGCATAPRPISPTVLALPAKGESFAVFQQHDALCRQFAAERVGGAPPGQVAANRAAAGAAIGAGVGAAAGAL
ncbi:MAG: hypothetical protein WB823_12980, partial [Steroidobacteraceae bacterium]